MPHSAAPNMAPTVPHSAAPNMAAARCHTPPLVTWRRAARPNLARFPASIYSAQSGGPPLRSRPAAAMRWVPARRAIRRHPRPAGGCGAVRAVSGGLRGSADGPGRAQGLCVPSFSLHPRGPQEAQAGSALSPRCLSSPPQQQSLPRHPVRGGEGGAAGQQDEEAQVRSPAP